MILLISVSLLFVAGGYLVAKDQPLLGYACMAFFGMGVIVGAVSLHPRSSYLEVTDQGFVFSSLFRRTSVPWEHVREFLPVVVQTNKMVGWNYSPDFTGSKIARNVSSALAGVEAALPDTYGMRAEDLAANLNNILASRRQ